MADTSITVEFRSHMALLHLSMRFWRAVWWAFPRAPFRMKLMQPKTFTFKHRRVIHIWFMPLTMRRK